jgi:hypothetical protein
MTTDPVKMANRIDKLERVYEAARKLCNYVVVGDTKVYDWLALDELEKALDAVEG